MRESGEAVAQVPCNLFAGADELGTGGCESVEPLRGLDLPDFFGPIATGEWRRSDLLVVPRSGEFDRIQVGTVGRQEMQQG